MSTLFTRNSSATGKESGDAATEHSIDEYVASHAVRKLHLGAGTGGSPGWLATDVEPQGSGVVHLDASARFPLDDATFDYVFSEHMIEHMPWEAGSRMLRECFRVMKPGATIRVATPDLAILLGLYTGPRDAGAERYVRWITDRALPGVGSYNAAFVINNAFRSWGHQFLYDADVLDASLRDAGFVDVRRCAYGESADTHLRGIERHGLNIGDESIAAFETMILEADKSAAARS